jgi:hypothetical protein
MASDPFQLPIEIAGIKHDRLEAALRSRNPDVTLDRFAIVDISHGTCTKIRLALEVDDVGKAAGIPERVILKGGFEPHSRMMDYMHHEEVRAYAEVAPASPLRMPACYFASFDAAAKQGIVIMEDLVARGVEFCNAQRPQSPDLVAKRLSVLARHHALTWGSTDLEPGGRFGWATSVITGFDRYATELLTPDVWQSYVNSARGAAASVRFHDLDWFRSALGKCAILFDRIPHVLIHGDTHLGNLYIDTDGEPGFFDSLPHRAPAMHEIAYHLACALDVADRRDHERALIAHYRGELVKAGVSPPSLDDLMHQYGCFLVLGYAIFLLNASDFQPEAINTAYTARFSAAMLDHDTPGLLEAV